MVTKVLTGPMRAARRAHVALLAKLAMASTRRLAAILAADVAGYSRLMDEDEEGTDALRRYAVRRERSSPRERRGPGASD